MTLRSLTMLLTAALTTLGAFGAVSSPAMAGGSLKDEPVAEARGGCTGGKFGGAYIGANIGVARHEDDKQDLQLIGNNFGDSDTGVTGGLYYGYNVQCDHLVFGITSDISFMNADTSQLDPLIGAPCGLGCVPSTNLKSEINWFSTSRVLIGLARDDRFMVYLTGGLAVGNVDHSVSDPILFGGFSNSHKDRQWGWTAGAGVDMLRDDRWMLRLEALYVDLGSENESYTVTTGCPGVLHDSLQVGRHVLGCASRHQLQVRRS